MSAVQKFRMRLRAVVVLSALVATAGLTTAAKGGDGVPLDGAPDQAAADVLHVARNQVGDDYAWGGNGPDAWDCSGLTSLWRTVGGAVGMPRTSREQQAWAVPIPAEQLKRGDLAFFGNPVTHVGIVSGGGYMVDAAESRKGVVERLIWSSGVVRFGRVPRPGMPRVLPWTPPPVPSADPAAPVADTPVTAPRTPRTTTPKGGLPPLTGLPGKQARPSTPLALRAAAKAKGVNGRPGWGDVQLVRTAWKHAGGAALPTTRAGIVAKGKRVTLADARVGDLVVYDRPDTPHLGVYLGHGYMVDASATLGRVVVRRVYAAPSVHLRRLG